MGDAEIVVFDLETTGFSKGDQIIQLAASTTDHNYKFNVYITPTRPVHPRASEITGLQLLHGELHLHGNVVHSVPVRKAFIQFMNYLRGINRNIILVAHNCFGFDMPRIITLANKLGFLNQFRKLVTGFNDSLVILRSALEDRPMGKGSFTMKALVQDYLSHLAYLNLHDAEDDVYLLVELLFHCELRRYIDEESIIESAKCFQYCFMKVKAKW